MKLKTALFAAAATIAISPSAFAFEGLYGAIGAGLSYMEDDLDVESISGPQAPFDSEMNTDNGIGVYTALGKHFGDSWRAEFEFSYRNNDVRSMTADIPKISAFPEGQMSGDISTYALMLNVLKDLDFLGGDWVTPYVGGGIGFAHIDADFVGVRTLGLNGINSIVVDSSDRRLAYQGIAGLAFKLAESLSLDLSYRYFGTLDPSFDGLLQGIPFKYEGSYANHSAFAGLRWEFGAPEAKVQVQGLPGWFEHSGLVRVPGRRYGKSDGRADPDDCLLRLRQVEPDAGSGSPDPRNCPARAAVQHSDRES